MERGAVIVRAGVVAARAVRWRSGGALALVLAGCAPAVGVEPGDAATGSVGTGATSTDAAVIAQCVPHDAGATVPVSDRSCLGLAAGATFRSTGVAHEPPERLGGPLHAGRYTLYAFTYYGTDHGAIGQSWSVPYAGWLELGSDGTYRSADSAGPEIASESGTFRACGALMTFVPTCSSQGQTGAYSLGFTASGTDLTVFPHAPGDLPQGVARYRIE